MFTENTTRSAATKKDYRARGARLFLTAERALKVDGEVFSVEGQASRVVMWFLGQDGVWKAGPIRVNKASLLEMIEILCRKRPDDPDARAAYNFLKQSKGPTPRKEGKPRTSARKRKAMGPKELDAIMAAFAVASHKHAPLAAGMLRFGTDFGLRPGEWKQTTVKGAFLIVNNAKNSNGRANGETRGFNLSSCTEAYVTELITFVDGIACALESEAWGTIYAAMRAQLSAACVRAAKIMPSLVGRPAAFYTARHVAGARAKTVMTPAEVAAFLGHATDRTARIHYARARSARGWAPPPVTPDPTQVATVVATFREREDPNTTSLPKPFP